MIHHILLVTTALLTLSLSAASAQMSGGSGKATLKDAKGVTVGTADLAQSIDGVLITVSLTGAPAGEHAFHIHAAGKCEPPFDSAGGHFNPETKKHGMMAANGHHAGDMPNLVVPASGELKTEIVNTAVTLDKGKPDSLFQPGGTALILHAKADDYKTDPTGNAGGRIACGVIE